MKKIPATKETCDSVQQNMGRVKSIIFMTYLACLSMLGFIATDLYLPAFNAIEQTFVTTPSQVAMSLTTFLAGLAFGQLLYGPLVNRIGKRRALIAGLSLFAVASLTIASSDSIIMLNIARFFQAIGVCSAGVIWQAIVIEQYDEPRAQQIFSNIMPLVALSPALAPTLGAYMLKVFDWRAIFILLCVLAIVLIWLTRYFVPQHAQSQHQQQSRLSYASLLKNRRYLGNVIMFGGCSGAFFAYLTVWPIFMAQQGYQAAAIGLSFIPQTIMFISGGYASKLILKRLGAKRSLRLFLSLFAASVMIIASITLILPTFSIYPLLSFFALLAAANGGLYPILVNNALQQFPQQAAKAAGLQNFLQISMAFAASSLVALAASAGAVTIGSGIVGSAVVVLIGYYWAHTHYRGQ